VQGSTGLVLLASGVLVWGIAGFVGSITGIAGKSVSEFGNRLITIHNTCVLISALLHLTGTILLIRPGKISTNRSITLTVAFFIVVLLSGAICISAYNGWIPPFFIEQSGATLLRQIVLASSIAMLFVTSMIMFWNNQSSNSFMYWYSLALVLLEIGLFGVMIGPVHGGVVSWLGRSSQFLSGPYMLAAVILSYRESRLKGISLEDALVGWNLSEQALRQSEEKFRLLFSNTSNGISFNEIIVDKQGNAIDYRFIDVNQSFERMTGLKASTIVGKTSRELFSGYKSNQFDWAGKFGQAALLGEQVCFEEFSSVLKKWFHVKAFQTTPGRFGVIFDDITIRKENEKKLANEFRCSEDRFRALVETFSNVVFCMSPDWCKMRLLRQNGSPKDSDTSDNNWLQKYIPSQEEPRVSEAINKAIATRQVLKLEHRAIKSDGSNGWAFTQAVPLIDDHGNIYEWFGISSDISERKEAEIALHQHTEKLNAANKELESFSYSVSHDLRSQLNAIKCLSQVLLEKYSDDFSEDVGDFIRKMAVSTDKMAEIINGMMNLARLTRESMICHHIDLVPIINAVFYELQQTNPEREVEISVDSELTAYADARLMHIALFNLIENAWKYSSKNPQARIELGTITMGKDEVFFIRDNGAGFNMKHADRLFEPFQRLHSEKHFPGTGIGLATVSKIIHRHGGKIWAESFVGEGATFYFTIGSHNHEHKTAVNETFDLNKKESHFEQFCKN
jgi:PAS domain S-box-containing protein